MFKVESRNRAFVKVAVMHAFGMRQLRLPESNFVIMFPFEWKALLFDLAFQGDNCTPDSITV